LLKIRRFALLWVGSTFALVFFLVDYSAGNTDQATFVVYQVNRHTALEWFDGGCSFSLLDSALVADEGKINYHMTPHRIAMGTKNAEQHVLDNNRIAELLVFRSMSFLRIQSTRFQPIILVKANYLVISGNGVKSLETLSRTVTFDYVVVDSSNSSRYAQRISEEAVKLGYPCHSVLTDGAFVANL